MTRYLKVLGLCLAAVFALSAIGASGASAANGKLTSTGPVILDGTEDPTGLNAITGFGQTFQCPGSTYRGEAVGGGMIPSGAEAGTLIPELNNSTCNVGGVKMTVHMNGCDIVIHSGETTGKAGQYGGTGELLCPKGQAVDAEVFASAKNENIKTCTIIAGAQGGSGSLTITNDETGGGTVSGTIMGIKGEKSGACGSEVSESGQIHVAAEVIGTNEVGGPTSIEVSD